MTSTSKGHLSLDSWVDSEQRCISFKYLSRSLGISADTAKGMMMEWREHHRTVYATWAISGTVESVSPAHLSASSSINIGTGHRRLVCLATDDTLEATKEKFSTISSCHIYSLQPGRVSSLESVIPAQEDVKLASVLSGSAFSRKCSSIVHHDAQALLEDALPTGPSAKILPPARLNGPVAPASKAGLPENTHGKRSEPKTLAAKHTGPSSLASAFAKTVKPFKKTAAAAVEVDAIVPVPVQNIIQTTTAEPALAVRTGLTKALAQSTKLSAAQVKRAEEHDAVELMMMDADHTTIEMASAQDAKTDQTLVDTEVTLKAEPVVVDQDQEVSVPVARRGRKKVKRQIHVQDEKGYLVTKDEWYYVSCSEDELAMTRAMPVARVKSKPKAAGQKAKSGGIASYFTKK
ncbi:DNA polymerase subunit Cdc27 [Protomyces lactucae-debilis]|uniref:DNA polymerase delta subunit 3 n=1 Tax=Protomyces lactucae-debilis TaxID=2754530 RepID=A0A1Y2FCG8_PROLT|nr:DNA polymerase subunit Cdc27 [Protomyces lactucae-debilis]ORY81612.1 DNA polymerase subunit Cdc27 [Protomyces lactucae-debilis]